MRNIQPNLYLTFIYFRSQKPGKRRKFLCQYIYVYINTHYTDSYTSFKSILPNKLQFFYFRVKKANWCISCIYRSLCVIHGQVMLKKKVFQMQLKVKKSFVFSCDRIFRVNYFCNLEAIIQKLLFYSKFPERGQSPFPKYLFVTHT